MSEGDKKTECIKVWMTERLFADLNRLAADDDRKLSEFICHLLDRAVYGICKARDGQGAERGE